ncbi:unnamed protein product [Hyaloperonospora brassicae]|uniref:RxLR effector candidate protein n=1 Tax=Hyaloperonospora brassicae TaxID=162125 RepID=A0AAV0TJV2_HYABA|nr:unnamed protein product [Hyaloperonospora brassicae]
MARSRIELRSLVAAIFVQLYAGHCNAVPSTETELNVCEYARKDLYVFNANTTSTVFPTGYISCENSSDVHADLCRICTCREKKVGTVAGLTVAGVVCVGSVDVTTCPREGQQFCGRNDSIEGATNGTSIVQDTFSFGENASGDSSSSWEGSSSNEDTSGDSSFLRGGSSSNEDTNAGDVTLANSSADLDDGNNTNAGSDSVSSGTSTSSFTLEPTIDHSSGIDASPSMDSNVSIETTSTDTDTNLDTAFNSSSIPVTVPESVNPSVDANASNTHINSDTSTLGNASEPSVPIDIFGFDTGSSSTDGASQSAASDSDRSIDTSSSSGTNIDASGTNIDASDNPSIRFDSLVKESGADDENVDGNVVGKVKPSPTSAAAPPVNQDIIRPRENGSALGTNNGSSGTSTWSGERLTVLLSTTCGIAVVAAIAAFVAVRRNRLKMKNELTTPTDDYDDESFGTATPVLPGQRGARNVGGGNRLVDAFENSPMASIVVLGPDDDFVPPPRRAPKRHYRSYPRNRPMDSYARSGSTKATKDLFTRDERPSTVSINASSGSQDHLLVSHGPPASGLPVRAPYEIFDTSNTRERFSSGMSSQFGSLSSGQAYESEMSFNSFRVASETSSGAEFDSVTSTNCSDLHTSSDLESVERLGTSCVSSAESTQYAMRDTEAIDETNESEIRTDLSRVAISFDLSATTSTSL